VANHIALEESDRLTLAFRNKTITHNPNEWLKGDQRARKISECMTDSDTTTTTTPRCSAEKPLF
jgi:hypothetical protein